MRAVSGTITCPVCTCTRFCAQSLIRGEAWSRYGAGFVRRPSRMSGVNMLPSILIAVSKSSSNLARRIASVASTSSYSAAQTSTACCARSTRVSFV
jgi:hypothetical protein